MRRYLLILAGLLSLIAPAAQAANSTVAAMTAGAAFSDTDLLYCAQSAGTLDRKCTPLQMAAYIFGKFSGDATANGTGTITLKNTGPGATGPLGSATVAPIVTIDAQGRVTGLTSATIAPPFSAVTGRTTLAQLPQGIANSIWINPTGLTADMQNVAIPACANDGAHGLVYVNGTGLQCAAITGSGSTGANPTATASDTAVNGVATTFMRSDAAPAIQKASASQFGLVEVDGTTIVANSGVISFNAPINAQVGTTYTVLSTDKGKVITLTNASAVAVTIPVASTSGFGSTFYTSFINEGAGLVTLTPTTSTIDGGTSLTLAQGQSVDLISDGANYFTLRGRPTNAAFASGTATLGTSAIASGACATVVTVAATGVATTDVVTAGYNGDPTAVTGYGASATGAVLTVYPYPTAGNVNVKVCNSTSASITPGAMTLNWKVVR